MDYALSITLTLLLCAGGCGRRPAPTSGNPYVVAADRLTEDYAHSPLSKWKIRAQAAGRDCSILFIETPMILEESLIDAIHYGAGAYGVHENGIDAFCRQRSFRGTAYQDRSGRIWTYGDITSSQAAALRRCRS